MSDSEFSSSDSVSEGSEMIFSSEEDDAGDYFVFNGDFAPYQGEPLATTDHDSPDSSEEDEDGILPFVLEQRLEGQVPVDDWCTCGNCHVTHLVGAREFRCCGEVSEAIGKFTFVGLDVECIINHPDFSSLTNPTVLEQVGPLLRDKDGRHYRRRNNGIAAQNKFLRAVAYRWLARWLFGLLGWENTRPLPSCVYHKIRSEFHTQEATGYVSGQERADS